jgi:hypothetical protein
MLLKWKWRILYDINEYTLYLRTNSEKKNIKIHY